MKMVFLSNYFNHHQKAFCDAMYTKLEENFFFVATSEMREERKKLGYGMEYIPPYVFHINDGFNKQLIDDSDVVIIGSAPEELIHNRIKDNKLIFRYTERFLKKDTSLLKKIYIYTHLHMQNSHKNMYLLCAGAYTAADYKKGFLFKNRAYKWGYFPQTKQYDIDLLMKNKNVNNILWCGRFLDWKHPDDVIRVAERLKSDGYEFSISYIGTGHMEEMLKDMIKQKGLENHIYMLGSMKPSQVREYMEKSGIYLFTSDFQEGWGAVLNESMNSGCAVVASHAIGAAPFLINHNENGLLYKNQDINDLYIKVKFLLENPKEQKRLGINAYKTISEEWNAEIASERFLKIIQEIMNQGYCDLYKHGPCSKANIIQNDWFKG